MFTITALLLFAISVLMGCIALGNTTLRYPVPEVIGEQLLEEPVPKKLPFCRSFTQQTTRTVLALSIPYFLFTILTIFMISDRAIALKLVWLLCVCLLSSVNHITDKKYYVINNYSTYTIILGSISVQLFIIINTVGIIQSDMIYELSTGVVTVVFILFSQFFFGLRTGGGDTKFLIGYFLAFSSKSAIAGLVVTLIALLIKTINYCIVKRQKETLKSRASDFLHTWQNMATYFMLATHVALYVYFMILSKEVLLWK